MTKRGLKELKKYFREIYPSVWEHYKFLRDRRTDTNRKFEFLLAFESLLTLIFVTLFVTFILKWEIIFIFPLIFFLVAIFISLYSLVPIKIWFPWFEKNKIKTIWENR